MRKFLDTFVLVVSSFAGIIVYVKSYIPLFIIVLLLQYIAFLSYATRIRDTSIRKGPYIFNVGYGAVLIAYLLMCYLFKRMIL
jgi:hypothetical protein